MAVTRRPFFGASMTLKTDITADATSVFLNTDDFAETITLYKGSDYANGVSVTAIVSEDNLTGSREAHGDGLVPDDRDAGKSIRQSLIIEIPASTDVQAEQDNFKPDIFKIGSNQYVAKVKLGQDDDLMSWLVIRRKDFTTSFPMRSG